MRRIAAPALALSLAWSLPGWADTLAMPEAQAVRADEQAFSVSLPARGMSKIKVERQYGVPAERIPAVGEPPISRWRYGEYTVYFEGDYVIHSVLNAQP